MQRLALLLLVVNVRAYGQVAAIHPPNPTSVDNIIVDVDKPDLELQLQPVVIVGNEVRITFSGYATLPAFGREAVTIGRLPAGNYTIIVTFIYEDTFGNPVLTLPQPPVPLVVAQGYFIPTLDEGALVALLLAVAFAGVVVLRR